MKQHAAIRPFLEDMFRVAPEDAVWIEDDIRAFLQERGTGGFELPGDLQRLVHQLLYRHVFGSQASGTFGSVAEGLSSLERYGLLRWGVRDFRVPSESTLTCVGVQDAHWLDETAATPVVGGAGESIMIRNSRCSRFSEIAYLWAHVSDTSSSGSSRHIRVSPHSVSQTAVRSYFHLKR